MDNFIQPGNSPSTGFNALGDSSKGAKLYIFNPMSHGATVIRPYVYNFDDNLVDQLSQANSASDALKNMGAMKNLSNIIVPAANGIEIETKFLDDHYSFILIIDENQGARSEVAFSNRVFRTIYTGYFIDEPINPLTLYTSNPTPNMNAYLVFTHVNSFSVNGRMDFGSTGTQNNVSIMANSDIVPATLDQAVQFSNLALCDVGSIANSYTPDSYSEQSISTGRPLMLSGFMGSGSPMIHDRVKSPKHQLIDIAYGIDSAASMAMSDVNIFNGLDGGLMGDNPSDVFQSNLYAHLQRPEVADIHQGINPSEGLTLGHLNTMYPSLDVKPVEIEYQLPYGVRDQRETNIQNIFSSMATNTISAIASANLLATVTFRYSSWNNNSLDQRGGNWEVIDASMMTEDDTHGTMLNSAINNFISGIESSLYPILLASGGEFDLMVSYNSTGATNVDLYFMDFASDDRGYYVAHNNLGGIISPAVGTDQHSENNRYQFDTLVNNLSNNAGFGSDIQEYNHGFQ